MFSDLLIIWCEFIIPSPTGMPFRNYGVVNAISPKTDLFIDLSVMHRSLKLQEHFALRKWRVSPNKISRNNQ